jgi:hypothetical protein
MKRDYDHTFKKFYENAEIKVCTLDEFSSQNDSLIVCLEAVMLANSGFSDEKVKQEQLKIINQIDGMSQNAFGCIIKELKNKN